MRFRPLLVAAGLSLGVAGLASASAVEDYEILFPAFPCHDGWASCLVDGFVVDAGPSYDGVGRPVPADMRIGWFDGQPTTAYNPFTRLSEYSGKSSKPPPPKKVDPPKQVASNSGGNTGGNSTSAPPPRDPPKSTGGNSNQGGSRRDPVNTGSDVRTPDFGTTPTTNFNNTVEPTNLNVPDDPPDEPAVVEVDDPIEEPPPPPPPAGCDDLIALEGPAMMGRLLPPQLSCMENAIANAGSQTQKDKLSRVLLMNAEAAGNQKEWERLMKRHLEDIDRSDPDLCFKYALHLSRGGVGRAWGVIKWADYALENKSRWTGTTYKTRVNSLYQLKAEAANRLWQDTTEKLVNASGAERDKLEAEEEKLRGMAKDYSLEWLDYARASGQDTRKAVALCVSTSGSKKFCKE